MPFVSYCFWENWNIVKLPLACSFVVFMVKEGRSAGRILIFLDDLAGYLGLAEELVAAYQFVRILCWFGHFLVEDNNLFRFFPFEQVHYSRRNAWLYVKVPTAFVGWLAFWTVLLLGIVSLRSYWVSGGFRTYEGALVENWIISLQMSLKFGGGFIPRHCFALADWQV